MKMLQTKLMQFRIELIYMLVLFYVQILLGNSFKCLPTVQYTMQISKMHRTRVYVSKQRNSNYDVKIDPDDDIHTFRSKRWILLVDDESSIRDAVSQLLIHSGYQVTTCSNGNEAYNIALTGQSSPMGNDNILETSNEPSKMTPRSVPDAIVSDIRMPIMDGITLLQMIRSNQNLVQVPVILLTAKGMPSDRVIGYKAGADAYLSKPFDPDELVTIIDTVIQRHETLNNSNNIVISDIQRDIQDIKRILIQDGIAGNTRVAITNVFFPPDERKVLQLLCQGYMTKEIASQMYMSTRRVEQLITSMFRKANVKNRTELVRWAISTGNVKI